jgi:hypothetical protein
MTPSIHERPTAMQLASAIDATALQTSFATSAISIRMANWAFYSQKHWQSASYPYALHGAGDAFGIDPHWLKMRKGTDFLNKRFSNGTLVES